MAFLGQYVNGTNSHLRDEADNGGLLEALSRGVRRSHALVIKLGGDHRYTAAISKYTQCYLATAAYSTSESRNLLQHFNLWRSSHKVLLSRLPEGLGEC